MIPKLTVKNEDNFFGVKVKHKELFNYTAAFMYRDVEILAKKRGYMVEYCTPNTIQYRTYGDRTCTALKIDPMEAMGAIQPLGWNVEKPLPAQWEEFRTKIGDLVLEFEAKKNEAADIRDKLRDIADEIKDIVESFDDGVEGMDEAIEQFRHALDDMSRYV